MEPRRPRRAVSVSRSSASPMSSFLSVARDPVPYQGALAAITIERLNGFVGLLVGLATLIYLLLRIRKEWRSRGGTARAE